MKKFLALIIALSVIPYLTACSTNKDNTSQEETSPTSSEEKISAETTNETVEETTEEPAYTTPIDLSEGGRHHTQSTDPIETVRSYIESEADKSYTKFIEFVTAQVDEYGTEMYLTKMIKEAGIADEPINSKTDKTYNDVNIALVNAEYYAEYDWTKVPFSSGYLMETFYLWQDRNTELWTIFDNRTPSSSGLEEWGGILSKDTMERCPSPLEWKPEYEGEIYTSVYWMYEPADDPVEVVKSAIENHAQRDFIVASVLNSAEIDLEETEIYSQRRKGSRLAQIWNISDEMFDSGRIIAVYADYYTDSVSIAGGLAGVVDRGQYFYLWQDEESLDWHIFESSYCQTNKGHEILWGVYS